MSLNTGFIGVISREISNALSPKLIKWLGSKTPLAAEQKQEIVSILNNMGPERVKRVHTIGVLCTLPMCVVIGLFLGIPFMFPAQTIFAGWNDLVLPMSHWLWVLAVFPIMLIAAILASNVAIGLVCVIHKRKWPGHDTTYLHYTGEAVTHGPDGFKIQVDYVALGRVFLFGATALYLVCLAACYLSTDLVTKTQYHRRSIIPFAGETIAHSDLIYVYNSNKSGGDLNLYRTEDDSLFLSRFILGSGDIQAEKTLTTLFDIDTVQLFRTDDGQLPNPQNTNAQFLADARAIIASEKGELRLWTHSPRVLVLSQDARAGRYLDEVRSAVEDNVTSPFSDRFFGTWQNFTLPPDWNDASEARQFSQIQGGPAGRQISVQLGTADPIHTDIVIVIADRATLAVLNNLWGEISEIRARRQAEGTSAHCFYSARFRNGVARGAYVSIPSDIGDDKLDSCIWEEVLHTLGPRQDAEGTAFFSFDDTHEVSASKRANDLLLIRALYESGAQAGGSPGVALSYLESIR